MRSRVPRYVPAAVRHSFGLALAAPEVMAHRLTRMALVGPTPSQRDWEEFLLMWTEKVAAFYESWHAMYLEMFRANLSLALSPIWFAGSIPTGRRAHDHLTAHGRRAAVAILGAGLAPLHRRAAANAKRLRRALV